MPNTVRIRLEPLGRTIDAPRGQPVQDLLFDHGVEFPCGGRGNCKGCRVRVLQGAVPATDVEAGLLAPDEIAAGWRLACHLRPAEDLVLEVAQWEAVILSDSAPIQVTGREGLAVAVDLGTTTLVAQMVDLATGHVLGVSTSLNPQAVYGSDVMSRVEAAFSRGEGPALAQMIRERVGEMVNDLAGPSSGISSVVVVGNTVMHHLFCGHGVTGLARVPFETDRGGLAIFRSSELGWEFSGDPPVRFLPCLGGFVGSDILAGILATRLHESEDLECLVDLGTNGEIVIGNRARMLCASTAAGPAFEGGLISKGMRASTGAISEIHVENGTLRCHVIGETEPRGICGSGLVDAAAVGLELGLIAPSGRLAGGVPWVLSPQVSLTQADLRQLQLAKAAVSAGIQILLRRLGASVQDVSRVYLAGAFGNYINRASARRIGLFEYPLEKVSPAGNTALSGAKLALFEHGDGDYSALRRKIEHIPLASDPDFQKTYVEQMAFPATAG